MAAVEALIVLVALIFTTDILAQVLADRYGVSSIIFLIVAGIVLDQEGVLATCFEPFGEPTAHRAAADGTKNSQRSVLAHVASVSKRD